MSKNSSINTKILIEKLIERIISYEDQIKAYEKNPSKKNAMNDLVKNKENITMLNQFIINETRISNEKISNLKKEITKLFSEYSNFEIPLDRKYTQKDYEQNLLKLKCYEKTLSIYNNEYISMEENLKMLKEEKKQLELELVNLMSLKETYEEYLHSNEKNIFKNLLISYDHSIGKSISMSSSLSILKNLDTNIQQYEMRNFSTKAMSNYIYKCILSKYITSLEYCTLIQINDVIEEQYKKFIKGNVKVSEFIKNCADMIVHSNDKLINFVDVQKFEECLRYLVKIIFFESEINYKIQFVNCEYKKIKDVMKEKYNNVRDKKNEVIEKMEIEIKEGEIIKNELNKFNEYDKKIKYANKQIKEKKKEINNIRNESNRNINNYKKEINVLEKLIEAIEYKINLDKSEKEIAEIRKKIDELFCQIRYLIKKEGEKEDNILNVFINEINNTLSKDNNQTEVLSSKETNYITKEILSNENTSIKDGDLNVSNISSINKRANLFNTPNTITPVKLNKMLNPLPFDVVSVQKEKRKNFHNIQHSGTNSSIDINSDLSYINTQRNYNINYSKHK